MRHPWLVVAVSSTSPHAVRRTPPALTAVAATAFVIATVMEGLLAFGPARARTPADFAFTAVALLPPVVIGCLVTWRVPENLVGPALAWVGATPALVVLVETWGDSLLGSHPWPGAAAMFVVKQGVWVWNFAGFVALCLVFPDGPLVGRFWRRLPVLALAGGLLLNAAVSLDPATHRVGGVTRAGYAIHLPLALRVPELVLAVAGFLAVLVATVASVVVRYRRSGELARLQLRWLMLSAGAVPLLLVLGWIAQLAGVPVSIWGVAFMLVMLVAVPIAVAIAILRHDLYDVDRLLGSSLAWLLTSLVSAAVFAVIVYAVGDAVGASSHLSVTGAAFVTAVLLLPVHRLLHTSVAGVIDRERTLILERVDEFVLRVRDGRVEPEQILPLLRTALRDPELQLLLRLPGAAEGDYADIDGRESRPHTEQRVPLLSGDVEVGLITLGTSSPRRVRQARAAALRARLPIEVVRLRIELRRALDDARSSGARLLAATTAERRRLERDLHDGAQQQILAVGMRLRSLQGRLDPHGPASVELDAAVAALEAIVAELRRLAHGIRPSRLEDGLGPALRALVADSPVPVELQIADVALSDVAATTVYFIVAEALANALKHAAATQVAARVTRGEGRVLVEISDDGVGGARPAFGLTSLSDRVAAAGGTLTVNSPPGGGTSIVAELACAS